MSYLFIPKKLKQLTSSSKKAWKSFTFSISPKLHNQLKLPKSLTKTARRLSNQHRRPYKGRRAARGAAGRLSYRDFQYLPPSTAYVDKLNNNNSNNINNYSSSSGGGSGSKGSGSNSKTGHVNWKEYVSKLPPVRGVDEKADEFISKFRQQMQLQREQSILEFQEILARSV